MRHSAVFERGASVTRIPNNGNADPGKRNVGVQSWVPCEVCGAITFEAYSYQLYWGHLPKAFPGGATSRWLRCSGCGHREEIVKGRVIG